MLMVWMVMLEVFLMKASLCRELLFLGLTTMLATPSWSRPVEESQSLPGFQLYSESSPRGSGRALGVAFQDTTYFGGTFWNADSSRWEAIQDSVWTFDTGVGSHFDYSAEGVDPNKDQRLHAYMEGWVGIDESFSSTPYFRRMAETDFPDTAICVGSAAGLGGDYSFWAGVLQGEADSLCYATGQGYGNSWEVCIERTFDYNGSGPVTLSYDYVNETEPGFDFSQVIIDTAGLGNPRYEILVTQYDGMLAGRDTLVLEPGIALPSVGGGIYMKFCFRSDGAWSDEDGLYATRCGAFAVDNISISGGGISHFADFETSDGGWALERPRPGAGGEWSNLVSLSDLPPTMATCECALTDSVLVFEDLDEPGHNQWHRNVAASPWIDLRAAGLDGTPGKFIETTLYAELPLLNYIFVQFNVQWYPEPCPENGLMLASRFTSNGFVYYFGGSPTCTAPGGTPTRIDFTGFVPPGAEQMRIALGVLVYCCFFEGVGIGNSTPWFDNVRLGVYGTRDAPYISTQSIDRPQDSFPESGALTMSHPGRIDCNNVRGAASPEPGSSLGDTLLVQGAGENMEVYVQFAVHPGPGIDPNALSDFLATVTSEETRRGLEWYSARMDTAELWGSVRPGEWMTTFHEDDPGFRGSDTDLDPDDLSPGGQTRLLNDIFPDDLLTPGSRLMLFYKTRYSGGSSWYTDPDTTGANYYEMEVLPSSYAADSTFNCVLYVDHADDFAGQGFIEPGLAAVLPGGSSNFENTAWDRWDVRASSSQQGSFGRPLNTQYGATLVQALGYRTIVWNSGRLNAFCLTKEDADVLIPWLTLPEFAGNSLYLSGDGIASSMWGGAPSEPSARRLLEDLAGVSLTCNTFRDQDCSPGTPEDQSICLELDPVLGAVVSTRPLGAVPFGQGNGCPDLRSFDVLQPNPDADYGSPVPEEQYVGEKTVGYASVSNLVQGSWRSGPPTTFKTVVDGLSLHHRRDSGACTSDISSPPLAIEGRLQEVFDWFGVPEAACSNRLGTTGIEREPPRPKYRTNLFNASPNPLVGSVGSRIVFTLAEPSRASLTVFDIRGRRVAILFEGDAPEGLNEVFWDGTDASGRRVASGVYFYRLRTEGKEFARKLVVIGD